MFIGDRATGKTALAMELIKPDSRSPIRVDLIDDTYENLKSLLSSNEQYKGTGYYTGQIGYYTKSLSLEAQLPAGVQTIRIDWLDTPGEVWSQNFPQQNPQIWQNVLRQMQNSEGIILVLPPYREIPGLKTEAKDDFPTQVQWSNRLQRWLQFFREDCPRARHIMICLNFADLFCNCAGESSIIKRKNWYQRHDYVLNYYFTPVKKDLQVLSYHHSAFVRCFLTTIYNRTLLELPWLYLASHLA